MEVTALCSRLQTCVIILLGAHIQKSSLQNYDAALLIVTERLQLFEYEPFSFLCEGLGSALRGLRNNNELIQGCYNIASSTLNCSIQQAYDSDSGVYWCEDEKGEKSNSVNITVTGSGDLLNEDMRSFLHASVLLWTAIIIFILVLALLLLGVHHIKHRACEEDQSDVTYALVATKPRHLRGFTFIFDDTLQTLLIIRASASRRTTAETHKLKQNQDLKTHPQQRDPLYAPVMKDSFGKLSRSVRLANFSEMIFSSTQINVQ
ncbi:hypothetical protein KUCAC02_009710 [Chaenocephalus aceratus]|nr:hypothetical protein KUCAC02_009710 [Chaenocephalus aceratus]